MPTHRLELIFVKFNIISITEFRSMTKYSLETYLNNELTDSLINNCFKYVNTNKLY